MNIRCLFGHDKNYVTLFTKDKRKRCWSLSCCNDQFHYYKVLRARWICKRCSKMVEENAPYGGWKIEFGKLVPDVKAWANDFEA